LTRVHQGWRRVAAVLFFFPFHFLFARIAPMSKSKGHFTTGFPRRNKKMTPTISRFVKYPQRAMNAIEFVRAFDIEKLE